MKYICLIALSLITLKINCSEISKKIHLYTATCPINKKQDQEKVSYQTIHQQLQQKLKPLDPSLDKKLWSAVNNNDIKTLKQLFAGNSIPNINTRNASGLTPLMHASSEGYYYIVQFLIDERAQLDLQSTATDDTAISRASAWGYTDIVKLLIDAKVNINTPNNKGRTPLMRAILNGYPHIAEMLINAGADLAARDEKGRTVLMLAVKDGRPAMVNMLIAVGADDTFENDQNHNKRAMDYASWWSKASMKGAIENGKRERHRYQKNQEWVKRCLASKLPQEITEEIADYSFGISPKDLPGKQHADQFCILM